MAAVGILSRLGLAMALLAVTGLAPAAEALDDLGAVVNRSGPSTDLILVGLIEAETPHLRTVRSETPAPPSTLSPLPPSGASGPCDVDPKNPPPLPPPRPPRIPKSGTLNPVEGRRAPYYGRVVDAERGTPLQGAVIVAVWTRRITAPFHARSETHDACDVLSAADGTFILDGRAIEQARVSNLEPPVFSVFMPGFSAWGISTARVPSRLSTIRGDVQGFHDVTVGLTRLQSREQRLELVNGLPAPASDTPLERVPRLVEVWRRERANLKSR